MKQLPVATVKPLILATNDIINLLVSGPSQDIKMFFTIEGVFVLAHWMPLFNQVQSIVKSDAETADMTDHEVSKLCFFLDLLGKFLDYNGTKQDSEFVDAIDSFFITHQKVVGQRNSEQLFWRAFPEISLKQLSGKPFDPNLRIV